MSKERNRLSREEYITARALSIGTYIRDTGATIRKVAKDMNISKTTVHNDIRKRLPELNPELSAEVNVILANNFSSKHLRGGNSTKLKFLKLKQQKAV